MSLKNRNSTSSIARITVHSNGKIKVSSHNSTTKKNLRNKFESSQHNSSQNLINPSFELWEDSQSPVAWKGENISREDNPTNIRTGKAALRMPVNSFVYQFISSDLQPYTVYQVALHARTGNKALNAPLTASVGFFSALGDLIGYETEIIIDPSSVKTSYQAFKILVEAPEKAQTVQLTLSVDASTANDNGNIYIIDDVTFQQLFRQTCR